MTTKNARFWDFVSDGWVKITLKPGQQLTHVTGGPDEEGYHYETTIYEHEGDSVVETCLSEARDCDGRFDHSSKHVCPLGELNSKPWDPSPSGYCPNWRSAHRSQRDYSAEAAGY